MKYFFLTLLISLFLSSAGALSANNHLTPPNNGSETLTPPNNGSETLTTPNNGNNAVLNNPLDSSISSIPAFFVAIINILMIFAIPFIVFFIIYAGFMYVTARGNAETIKKAHNALLYALIGGLLILGSRTLLTIITNTVEQIK
jgi:hypothetical protein